MSELAPGSVVAGYTVVRKLGSGEMGEVHEVSGRGGERLALKILRGTLGGAQVEQRFAREAKLCAALQHPNVVSVSDHGMHVGSPFFVMQLLRGGDLEAWLSTTGALAPEVAVAIVLQACAGVRAAHEAGVVHRDLKPANVFLDESDEELRTIVCDFGVAKVRDEDGALTASGAVLGTPLYMAPEQLIDSKRVDARCDVWALGMILYHALAGTSAFHETRSIGELILALNQNAVPPLQERAPWVSPALARVVHAALLPLDRRLATVRDLEEALLRWAPGERRLGRDKLAPISPDRKAQVATVASLPADASELGHQAEDTLADPKLPAAAAEEVLDSYVGRTLAGRYRIVVRIGSGGMGAVYEAIDSEASDEARVVALKVMHPEAGARAIETVRRFLREAKATSRIESAHVARFIDSGLDPSTGAPFIVMERLRGRDLATHLARSGALDVGPTVALFLQACDALQAAHALGIVHRDIKPSNLFLHEEGSTITLKVCDFGIAKLLSSEGGVDASTELTRSGGLVGSPLYMSPEQAKSAKNVDERSDVFSLALTLHESLSGVRPWEGRTSMGEVIVAVCTEDVPPLATMAPWIDIELSAVIAKALERDAARRFATIGELAKALERFADRQTVARADLGGVPSSRKAQPARTGGATFGGEKNTADALSITNPVVEQRRWRTAALGALAVVVVGGGAVAAFGVNAKSGPPDTPATSNAASGAPSALAAGASSPAASEGQSRPAPSASATNDTASAASASTAASASAGSAAATALGGVTRRPRIELATADAGRAASPPDSGTTPKAGVSAAPPPSGVGRGMTATDIPGEPH